MEGPDGLLHDWAVALLKASVLPETRNVEKVVLVEPGCICFITNPLLGRRRARTALLKEGVGGPFIYRVIDGFPLVEAGTVYQGPIGPSKTNT